MRAVAPQHRRPHQLRGRVLHHDRRLLRPPTGPRPPSGLGRWRGEKVTLRVAAQYADGWNLPFISPEEWARKSAILDGHCDAVGRDPKAVTRTVNVGIAKDDADLRQQFDKIADFVRPGVLMGEGQELVDRVGEYIEAGAEAVIVAMRTPFDLEALDRFAETVIPAFT